MTTIKCRGVIDLTDLMQLAKMRQTFNQGFYVDTNIWYKITYEANPELVNLYPQVLSSLLNDARTKLLRSKLSFSELANLIDRYNWQGYQNTHHRLPRKAYRQLTTERQVVISAIDNRLKQVETYTDDVESDRFEEVLNYITESNFVETLAESYLDPTDAMMINIIRENGVKNVITDDKDYLSVSDIYLFTLNGKAIERAKREDKLLTFPEFLEAV